MVFQTQTVKGFELSNSSSSKESPFTRKVYFRFAKTSTKLGHNPDQPRSESFASACRDKKVTKQHLNEIKKTLITLLFSSKETCIPE